MPLELGKDEFVFLMWLTWILHPMLVQWEVFLDLGWRETMSCKLIYYVLSGVVVCLFLFFVLVV